MTNELTILVKEEVGIGALGKIINLDAPLGSPEGRVMTYDKRNQGRVSGRTFETAREVSDEYNKAIRTSVNRGWKIGYRGDALNWPPQNS